MSSTEKVLYDIQFIIKALLNHLQKKNQLHFLLNGDVTTIKEKLYELYSFDYRFQEKMLDIVDWEIHSKSKGSITAEFKKYKNALGDAEAVCLEGYQRGILSPPRRSEGWFYIGIKNRQLHARNIGGRVYLNCRVDYLPQVIQHIINHIERELNQEVACNNCRTVARKYEIICRDCQWYLPRTYPVIIKFLNPQELRDEEIAEVLRPEKVVLYIFPWPVVLENLSRWLTEIDHLFYDQVPLFAKKIAPGVGYAPEPTAKQKELSQKDGGNKKTASFGELMCFLVAKVICTWASEEHRVPTDRDIITLTEWTYKEVMRKKYEIEFDLGMKE